MVISRADVGLFITAMCMRNQTMGIPALEHELFANLLMFDYFVKRERKREGKREGEREGQKGREGKKGRSSLGS